MTEGWYVPGGACIGEGVYLHIVPPDNWQRVIIDIPRVPASMNTNAIRSHWSGFQEHKKAWQDELAGELLLRREVRRGGYERALAGAFLRFPKRAKKRDTGNFSLLLEKALGDALQLDQRMPVDMKFIPDDDAHHYYFGGVEFEEETGPARTLVYLFLQPKGE
jgi:hypothetical protein